MRSMLALMFFIAAAVLFYVDWDASVGAGLPLAMTSTQAGWLSVNTSSYEAAVTWAQGVDSPYVWRAFSQLLVTPLAPVLLVISMFFFVIRRRPEPVRHYAPI